MSMAMRIVPTMTAISGGSAPSASHTAPRTTSPAPTGKAGDTARPGARAGSRAGGAARRQRRGRDAARNGPALEPVHDLRPARQIPDEHRDVLDGGSGEEQLEAFLELGRRQPPVRARVAEEVGGALALGVGGAHRCAAALHTYPSVAKRRSGRKKSWC